MGLNVSASQYLKEYGRLPVKVTQGSGVSIKKYILKNFDGKNFVLAQEGMEEMEILLPVNTTDPLKITLGDEYKNAMSLFAERKFDKALELYRPFAYSLVKFIEVPTNKINAHQSIRILIDALLEVKATDELYDLYMELDIREIDSMFVDKIFDVVSALIAGKKYDKSMELIKSIPLGPGQLEYLDNFIQAAGLLVVVEEYDKALELYERTQRFRESELYQQVLLWISYCKGKNGDETSSQYMLDKVGELKENDPDYSLFQLIKGLAFIRKSDFKNAMDCIAQGVVSADRSAIWMPELLYQSAFCYQNLEKKDVAKSIQTEMKLFFPESVWSSKKL
jgi:tetratricopeptide (TPR) repeat protein